MDSFERFNEISLPSKKHFFNDLTEEGITDEDYNHALKTWESFNMTNLGDYHDFYMNLDTALLADIIENTRELLYEKYELELGHYFSIPMLAFDAALKYTDIKLEYIRDSTMHCWVETAIRGGFCGPGSLRAAQANNVYMGDEYDPNKKSNYILYIDANNLCKN